MRQLYFSHSYRNEEVNRYFLDLFAEHEVRLLADRKSQTWCVPKVEKHIFDCDGLVAVVPERRDSQSPAPYSEYIAQEIALARRAAIPHLIFADGTIAHHFKDGPSTVVPFHSNRPQAEGMAHELAIDGFCSELGPNVNRKTAVSAMRQVSVFVDDVPEQKEIAELLEVALRARAYNPHRIVLDESRDCIDDLGVIGPVRAAEFSVFCTENRITQTDLALAIAHALCTPAFRIRRDPEHPAEEPDLNGWIRWATMDDLYPIFLDQINSYSYGFLEAVLRKDNARELPAMLAEPEWDPSDPLSLVAFVRVGDRQLRTDLNAIRNHFGQGCPSLVALGRNRELCRQAYERIHGHNWLYEFEPGSEDYSRQRIRTPLDMHADTAGTCLDFACLFAALLENMQADPVIAHFRSIGEPGAHVLAGCWIKDRSQCAPIEGLAGLKKAMDRKELILFETTGAARSDESVAGEKRRGTKTLSFETAVGAARGFVDRNDIEFGFFLDVLAARCQ